MFRDDGNAFLCGIVDHFEKKILLSDRASNGSSGRYDYAAPECSESQIPSAVDVFSLGMIMYAMVTHRRPFDGCKTLNVEKGLRPQFPDDTSSYPIGLAELIRACWSHDARDRPSMQEVKDSLLVIGLVHSFRRGSLSRLETRWSKDPDLVGLVNLYKLYSHH